MEGYACLKERSWKLLSHQKKKHVFHHENIACLDRFIDKSQSYDNRTENKTLNFDLLV